MLLFHSHESSIRIGLTVAVSVAENFLLLFIFFKVNSKIFYNVAAFGFRTGLVISFEDLVNLTRDLFYLFLFYFLNPEE